MRTRLDVGPADVVAVREPPEDFLPAFERLSDEADPIAAAVTAACVEHRPSGTDRRGVMILAVRTVDHLSFSGRDLVPDDHADRAAHRDQTAQSPLT